VDPYQYTTLISSLPHQPALFTEKQTALSRIRLDSRLSMLDEDHARMLALIEGVLAWSRQEFGLTDAEVVRRARRTLDELPEGLIRDIAVGGLDMRTVVAALRRRKAGEPAPGPNEIFGHGRWVASIRDHWSEPDFRLSGVFPWVAEANRLLVAGDTIGLQRLLLTESWRRLERIGADGHEFDFAAVVIYVLRWDIVDRWSRYDAGQASARFEQLASTGLGAYARWPEEPISPGNGHG
jgi:hypothetical protein